MMRTPSLVLASLALAAAPVAAQSGINLVGGLVSAKFTQEIDGVSFDDDFANRSGFAIGVGLNRAIASSISFAPELLYVVKGAKDPDSDANAKFSYIELPLLLRYNFSTGGQVRPFLTAGPTVAFLMSCDIIDDEGDSETCDDTYGEEDSYDSMDFGGMVGAGLMFNRIGISVRYEMGFKDIDKAEDFVSKNKALMVLASFAF
jgi:opacity protein-like surface antigen